MSKYSSTDGRDSFIKFLKKYGCPYVVVGEDEELDDIRFEYRGNIWYEKWGWSICCIGRCYNYF